MSRRWTNWMAGPVLLLTLLVTACEPTDAPGPRLPTAPETAAGPQAAVVGDDGESYERVEGRLPGLLESLSVSTLIGSEGGSLSLAGHTVTVPAGAVEGLTLFTLTLTTDGYVAVELSAVAEVLGGLLGRVVGLVDVGGEGFDEPVELSLTYSRATGIEDPGGLVILREPDDDGPYEVLPSTVDEDRRVVVAELDHFSRYCMAQ